MPAVMPLFSAYLELFANGCGFLWKIDKEGIGNQTVCSHTHHQEPTKALMRSAGLSLQRRLSLWARCQFGRGLGSRLSHRKLMQ